MSNKFEETRQKLNTIINTLNDCCHNKQLKLPKNYTILFRKFHKYIKPYTHIIHVSFDNADSNSNAVSEKVIKENKKIMIDLDNTWFVIISSLKEWIYKMFYIINEMSVSNESPSKQLETFVLLSFNIIKEVCNNPPLTLSFMKVHRDIASPILYILAEYFIIIDNQVFFKLYYEDLIQYTKCNDISYKFFVIIIKLFLKYFYYLDSWPYQNREVEESIFIKVIQPTEQDTSDSKFLDYRSNKIFQQVVAVAIENLSSQLKVGNSVPRKAGFFSFFSKTKTIVTKELDGSIIIDFFTILNTSEEYSSSHLSNIAGFSIIFELIKFLYDSAIESEKFFERIISSVQDIIPIVLSYCIRIFDQSENYLETNKSMNIFEKNSDYNMSLIEAAVLESLKIINLICIIDNSLVPKIYNRILQVYERIALKQSGLVFLEILQFFINNYSLMTRNLDNDISLFFKIKLKYNYKFEMLSFACLEFLYKNREIINEMTEVFSTFFPLILKIFATFPKYVDSKFFTLIDYMTKRNTINELFNYILDLPSIILIIENFECYVNTFNNNTTKLEIEEMFQEEYVKLVKFLLRDESLTDSFTNLPSIEIYNRQLELLFKSMIFTTRVHSTTKIVPKIMNKFLNVILMRDDIDSASDAILLIFERFSYFNENENYIQEIRSLLLKKLEDILKKWNSIVKELEEKIINEVNLNYPNMTKRELICLLCWAIGEYLKAEDYQSDKDGVKKTFKCLENLLRDHIKFFYQKVEADKSYYRDSFSVEETVEWYSTYFLEKTTEEEILNERILNIIIISLCKLAIKFKSFISSTIKCFQDVQVGLSNVNLINKLKEMLMCLVHVSLSTEYLISKDN